MQELQIKKSSGPVNYLTELLQKNSKSSSKAKKYVAQKNIEISQRLINGDESISNRRSEIKILKNDSDNDKNKFKQDSAQNQKDQKKVLIIADEQTSNAEEQKKSPPKQINDEQRLKFVKQKIKENKIIAKRKQEYLKQVEERQKIVRKKQEEEKLKKEQEIRLKRVEQTRKKIQQIEKRKEQRIMQNIKTNEILKEKSKEKILADKINEKYLSSQNLMLDQKKKKLAQIRQIHKPMDHQQIEQHIRKFQESRLQRSRKKESQKEDLNASSQKKNQYYRSMFHNVLQRQKKQKEQEEIEHQYRIKELKDKGKKYAQEVKAHFKPEIDENKRKQIQKRIKSSSLTNQKEGSNKLKGIQYLQFTKQYAVKYKKQPLEPKQQKVLVRQEANKTQQTDYLTLARKNNTESRLKRSVTSSDDFIKKIQNKNLTSEQKKEQIMQFAENLERKARQKQQFLNLGNGGRVNQEVDKLYISAIQAKLRVLQT